MVSTTKPTMIAGASNSDENLKPFLPSLILRAETTQLLPKSIHVRHHNHN